MIDADVCDLSGTRWCIRVRFKRYEKMPTHVISVVRDEMMQISKMNAAHTHIHTL